jgi:hypothetical protein
LALVGAFRSRVSLEAENTILRHQLNVLRRKSPKRPPFGMLDRLVFPRRFQGFRLRRRYRQTNMAAILNQSGISDVRSL